MNMRVEGNLRIAAALTAAERGAAEKISSEFLDAQMALSAPRMLMSELKVMMQSPLPPTEKLHEIVKKAVTGLRGDAGACFITRPGEMLEVYASVGFGDLVHAFKPVRLGDGLIGDIAAQASPYFLSDLHARPETAAARPETGMGSFKSFCGVPILRGGRVLGVLSVQNRLPRHYGEDVIDILQTIAIILSELIIGGDIISRREISSVSALGQKPNQVSGVSLGRGLAIGTVVLYEPPISMNEILVDDTKAQKMRLSAALASMHDAIDRMLNRNTGLAGSESRDILEAYQMFARDRGWLAKIEATVEKGLSAEAAVQRVQNETRARMMQMSDAYIRDRLQDMEDLSNRLLSHLVRQGGQRASDAIPDNIVLVARSLGPAALLDYDHRRLKAVVLEKGSHTNHVAIVARALGIPIIGQCRDVMGVINTGDQAIIDGDNGTVYINPSEYIIDLFTKSLESRASRSRLYRKQMQQQSITADGTTVGVMMNAGLMSEIDAVQTVGADGVGLFRTELSFMGWPKYPLVVTQAELYGKIMDKMGDKPIVFRTLDIGGDKPLPYFKAPEEDNPALGWRAVRIGMDRPAVLRTQFRAFIRASRGRQIKIMLPFVTEVAEFDRARQLLEMEKIRARNNGIVVPDKIELGVMLEVPSLVWQLDALLKTVSFVSVGTNDLMQYMFAADRGSQSMRNRYDVLSPAMLAVLKHIADKCRAAKVPVGVCGEMAGHPLEAMVLIALGYQTLSIPAQSVETVKFMIPTLDCTRLRPYLDHLMQLRDHSLRERLLSFARDHKVHIPPQN
jgi:phosphotransferase system enzyme I (PtsP)